MYTTFSKYITLISALILLVGSAGALSTNDPIKPTADQFYHTKLAELQTLTAGSIIKTRVLHPSSFPLLPHLFVAHQIVYSSRDANNAPIDAVTTLLVPKNADPTKLLSFQWAEDSGTIDCAPSYMMQKKFPPEIYQAHVDILIVLLQKGWYINVPDHEGPDSLVAVGANAGHCVLDSIRAILSTENETKLRSDAKVQLVGYSGGAHATAWATHLHASYAPDLTIVGAAFGGTPISLPTDLFLANKGPNSAFILISLIGLAKQYPHFRELLELNLLPDKKQLFNDASNYCLDDLERKYTHQDIYSYFSNSQFFSSAISNDTFTASSIISTTAPQIPIHMYHAEYDSTVPYNSAYKLYKDWCSHNDKDTAIEFVSYPLPNHGKEITTSAIAILTEHFIFPIPSPSSAPCRGGPSWCVKVFDGRIQWSPQKAWMLFSKGNMIGFFFMSVIYFIVLDGLLNCGSDTSFE